MRIDLSLLEHFPLHILGFPAPCHIPAATCPGYGASYFSHERTLISRFRRTQWLIPSPHFGTLEPCIGAERTKVLSAPAVIGRPKACKPSGTPLRQPWADTSHAPNADVSPASKRRKEGQGWAGRLTLALDSSVQKMQCTVTSWR
ncbi:hypothetical protein PsYK624_092400 [Phanerochaete sordida]|uniref:Uncharacterized protein n=1 Tax=Phanerochaete sordida TaxID=48140 RepID=A0A9P3GDU1_9APHY|nr:hypothetical protein PsYK624_092400 [Phanerochaete sordida]